MLHFYICLVNTSVFCVRDITTCGALTRARHPHQHHRHVVCVQENLCGMPFLTPVMDGDRHSKQLQDIDISFQTECRAKPYPAQIGSKPECRRSNGRRREESPLVPAGQEFHPSHDVRAGCREAAARLM